MWVGELGEYAVIDNMLVPRASLPRTNAGGNEAEPGRKEGRKGKLWRKKFFRSRSWQIQSSNGIIPRQ
ncbi:unnamed protein product [Callosobruchus maculatus]|uniref:Uncharacterized protein n=1 Tax=Callosobruchus maculatus TaxID=64391 RepID=A0A653DS68_CALMS|nr:unnamed protein product [Callosobruchus maculatus]